MRFWLWTFRSSHFWISLKTKWLNKKRIDFFLLVSFKRLPYFRKPSINKNHPRIKNWVIQRCLCFLSPCFTLPSFPAFSVGSKNTTIGTHTFQNDSLKRNEGGSIISTEKSFSISMIDIYHEMKIQICCNSQYFKNVFPRRCVWHSQKLLPGMFGLARAGHIADYTTEDGKNGVLSIVAIPTNTRRRFNSNHANTTLRDQSMLRCSASFMCNLIYTNKSFVIAHDNLQKTKTKRVITFSDRLIHCKIGSKAFGV